MSDISQLASAALALLALVFSLWAFKKSSLFQHYYAFDHLYADLLKLAIEHPHFRMPNTARSPEQQQQYEIYAHLAWCFVESVYDHSKENPTLMETWRSAITIETRLHRAWLERPESRFMFKDEFHQFVAREFPEQIPQSPRASSTS